MRLMPADRSVRVRGVQVRGAVVEVADGGRTALNLAGVELAELHRGMVLTSDRGVVTSDRLLVVLERPAVLAATASGISVTEPGRWPPTDRTRARLSIGTDQVGATVGRAGRDALTLPDGRVAATIRLDRPIAVATADRFVLRRPAPATLVAGGSVLDPGPPTGPGRRRQTPGRVAALAATAVAGDSDEVAAACLALHGILAGDGEPPRVAEDVAGVIAAAALEAVAAYHAEHPADRGMPVAAVRPVGAAVARRSTSADPATAMAASALLLDRLIEDGRLVRDGDRVRLPEHRPTERDAGNAAAMDALVAMLAVPSPPSLSEALRAAGCSPDAVRALEAEGRIVVLEPDLAYAAEAYRDLTDLALRLCRAGPLTPAAFRDATGTSRRYVMAILEDLGRRSILRRTPDGHVPGPRGAAARSG
jgi:selenocysteine-specific elongation factor